MFCIPQRYDFSSKSQLESIIVNGQESCFVYRKGTIFQANHNRFGFSACIKRLFCIPQRYDFSSKSQLGWQVRYNEYSCFVYRKGTIFQANHNILGDIYNPSFVVLYTAKVRFFKQITTKHSFRMLCQMLFCIPQRYDFSSKSQQGLQS